ncbi:hypothetical protein [Butyrivibrio proteoclasticus]|uniref:hypothetical protein n=1 Tax=Butyrivibrio proteoclasticus TaxID=43305 RepID=UPI0006854882|nr:hypothetical protein [Butyrivibrio proteoclasticus]
MEKRTINAKGIVAAAMAMTLTLTGCTGLTQTDPADSEDVVTEDENAQNDADKKDKNKDKDDSDKKDKKSKKDKDSDDSEDDNSSGSSFKGLQNASESEKIYNQFLNDELDGDTYSDYVKNEGVTGYDFYDYDNDGIEELVLFSDQYYNMAAFEIQDGEVVKSISGGGTASRLSFHRVADESWVCYADYEHLGYEDYTFIKYKGYDKEVSKIHFYREDEDDVYDESSTYKIDDEEVDRITFNRSFNSYMETERLYAQDRTLWLDDNNTEFKWNGKNYTFTSEYDDDTCYVTFTLTDGEDELEKELDFMTSGDNTVAYVMIQDGEAYIYVFEFNETFGSELFIYDLNKKSLEEPVQYDRDFCLESPSTYIYEPGAFTFANICLLVGNPAVTMAYKVGKDGMPEPYFDNGFAYYKDWLDPVTTLQDIDCQEITYLAQATDEYEVTDVTIKAGTVLKLYRTDCESFVDFHTEDGRIIRMNFELREETVTVNNGSYNTTVSYLNGTIKMEDVFSGYPVCG